MTRIGIDAIHLSAQGKGLSRFEHCFLQALAKSETGYQFVVFLNGRAELPNLPQADHLVYVMAHPPNLLTWELIQLPLLARRWGASLVQTMSDRLPITRRPKFLMYLSEVPDHRIRAGWAQAGAYQRASDLFTRLIIRCSLSQATRIAVPSRATRNELLSRYQVPEAKVRIVYEAAGPQFVPEANELCLQRIRERYGAPDGYALHFSSANDPRDNTATVLRAFSRGAEKFGRAKKLVVAGKADFDHTGLSDLATELGLADQVVLVGFISDHELPQLYQAADVYFDPSLYEGFGLQVLEAMACGTPVICANVTSLPEIVGEAAIMAAPMDYKGFADALVEVLTDAERAATMRARGLKEAKRFSWAATVRQIVEMYAEALS